MYSAVCLMEAEKKNHADSIISVGQVISTPAFMSKKKEMKKNSLIEPAHV